MSPEIGEPPDPSIWEGQPKSRWIDERAVLAARHYRVTKDAGDARRWEACHHDGEPWPCDTARALALPPDPERLTVALHPATCWNNEFGCSGVEDHLEEAAAIIAAWEAETP